MRTKSSRVLQKMLSSLLEPMPITNSSPLSFEIGVVYRSPSGRFYLAVDWQLLITFVHDVIVECECSTSKFSVTRNISVEKLCREWNISQELLDEMSSEFFAPIRSNRAKRRLPDKFSSREHYSQDMVNIIWARLRTHRVIGAD